MREIDAGRYLATPRRPRQRRPSGHPPPELRRNRLLARVAVVLAVTVLSASAVGADHATFPASASATAPAAIRAAPVQRPIPSPQIPLLANDGTAAPASMEPPTSSPTALPPTPLPSPVPPMTPVPTAFVAAPTPAPPAPAPPASPSPPTPSTGWVTVLNDQFNAASDLEHWTLYDGPYGSGPHNCATPSHASVSDGMLRLLMRYEASGGCGAGWYTAGMMVDEEFGGVDQRVTLRFRIVDGGVIGHHNLPLRWPTTVEWPVGGEENYCEGGSVTQCWLFLHYGASNSQVDHSYPVDLRSWHTMSFERRDLGVRVFLDDLATPIWTYTGTATTLPETFKRVVLQQECSSTCPAGTSGTEEIQVDWIIIENPAP